MATLFTVPIASTGGAIVCTNPTAKEGQEQENVYLLTFTSPKDNRLTPTFIDAMVLALDIIEQRYPKGVVVTTSGIAKFYSNGLDLEVLAHTEGFLENWLWRLFRKLLTYFQPFTAWKMLPEADSIQVPHANRVSVERPRLCRWLHAGNVS